ncbi:DUF5655 domain-containing protein [Isoptericola sp. 4D.3]|uniref:DUF5655 domain-containing protein n=1 Tax=Isoptericola peretonis TaxID=2918523 RepID=A0ABT0J6Z4_9MICO|nr:DUF5655 domain-containing protein [Isoptericola sp. 4D.3]
MPTPATPSTPERLFAHSPVGLAVCRAFEDVVAGVTEADVTTRTTKTQVAFRRRRAFAFVWPPWEGLRDHVDVPAVVSFVLPRELRSPRVKEVAHPSEHAWTHHVEVRDPAELDDEIAAWVREAYDAAG